jgi:hypothetical protein
MQAGDDFVRFLRCTSGNLTPGWFAHQHSHGDIDFRGYARAAYEVLSGGYAQKWDPHQRRMAVMRRDAVAH